MLQNYDTLKPAQQALLEKHLSFVNAYNRKVNLTHINSFEQGRLLHIEDSLAALAEVNKAPAGVLLDLGSGAGFPGIPLAIATARQVLLLESIQKKAQALEVFIAQEKLDSHIKVIIKRSEEYAHEAPACAAVVTARAVGELPELIELAAPLMMHKGQLICYKAKPSPDELIRGLCAASLCGLREQERRSYVLSDGLTQRMLVVYEKIEEPQIKLPRRNGMAKKKPLA
jgi:16S rRNA (guanine527-N7)-methyltransferase